MEKAWRMITIDEMTTEQLKEKRKDNIDWMKNSKTIEWRDGYKTMVEYIDLVIWTRQQLLLNFESDESNK